MLKLNLGLYDGNPESIYLFSGSFVKNKREFIENKFIGKYCPQRLTKEEFVQKHQLVIQTYVNTLPEIAKYLNDKNNTTFSLRFWHPFLSFWLATVIDSTFDKFFKINKFLATHNGGINFNGLNLGENIIIPDDSSFNASILLSAELNEFISTEVLKVILNDKYKISLKEALLDLSYFRSPPSLPDLNIEFIEHIAGFSNIEKSILNFWGRFFNKNKKTSDHLSLPAINIDNTFNFDWIFLLKKLIPQTYFKINSFLPTKEFMSNAIIFSSYKVPESKKAYASIASEKGLRLYLTQHGSCYGDLLISTRNYLCEYLNDGFISWGWRDHKYHPANIISMPSPILSKLYLRSLIYKFAKKNNKIILISTIYAPNEGFVSSENADFYLEYKKNLQSFFNNLSPTLRERFWWRPRFTHSAVSFNDELVQELKKEFSWIKILTESLDPELIKAALVIHDGHGSAIHKSLVVNTPSIFFWRKDDIFWNDELENIFNLLKENKYLFYRGEDLAIFLNQNHKHIKFFWNQTENKKVFDQLRNILYKKSIFPLFDWIRLCCKL